jgi:hypothetical protein
LLNELGYDADSRPSLTPSKWLPDVNDTLVARLSNTFSIGAERDLLIEWVENGGHLVLLPATYESRTIDEFLDTFGLQFTAIDVEDAADGENDDEEEEDEAEEYTYIIDLDNTEYRIELLEHENPGATLTDTDGLIAVRHSLGSGFLTVFAGSHYFVNSRIDDHDHARLMLDALAGFVEPGTVWFIYDAAFPPLWEIIWANAPYVVLSLAIMLVLWLWSVMPKFGPAIRPIPLARRSIMEHVSAAGHFVWRHDGAATLAGCAAAAVMHSAEYRHPGISRLPMKKQASHIATMTGMPEATILEIFMNRADPRHREFTRNMQALQNIRQEL